MKNCWSTLFLAAVLCSFTLSVLGGHHGHGSNIAHILAAGLIVQLLGSRSHHHGHHHEGRHSGADIHSERSPYGAMPWEEEQRAMTPESTLSNSQWAARAPMDIAFSMPQYREPAMDSYNIPYYYHPHAHNGWRM